MKQFFALLLTVTVLAAVLAGCAGTNYGYDGYGPDYGTGYGTDYGTGYNTDGNVSNTTDGTVNGGTNNTNRSTGNATQGGTVTGRPAPRSAVTPAAQ